MKKTIAAFENKVSLLDGNKVRLVLFVLTLAMFILSAGAPNASGGI